jgi:hypothetical protein
MWEKEKKDWEAREKTLAAELETAKKARTEVTQAALTSVVPVAGQSSFISQISQLPAGNNSFYNNTPPQLYAQQQQPVLQSVGASSTPTELNLPKGWSIAQRSEKQKEIAAGWGVNSLPAHRENTASGLTISRFSDIESMRANAKRFQ